MFAARTEQTSLEAAVEAEVMAMMIHHLLTLPEHPNKLDPHLRCMATLELTARHQIKDGVQASGQEQQLVPQLATQPGTGIVVATMRGEGTITQRPVRQTGLAATEISLLAHPVAFPAPLDMNQLDSEERDGGRLIESVTSVPKFCL